MTVTALAPAAISTPAGTAPARDAGGVNRPRSAAAVDRRRREALARLSARVMPLPGRPLSVAAPQVALSVVRDEVVAPKLPQPMLTDREVEVLRTWLMLDSKPAVAQSLFISLGTVNTHLTRIRAKYADLGRPASTKAALVARAIQDDIVDIDEL